MHANITNEMLLVYGGLAFGLLWAIVALFSSKKPTAEMPADDAAEYAAARAVIERVRTNPITGEDYMGKITVVPCTAKIVDPVQRKTVKT